MIGVVWELDRFPGFEVGVGRSVLGEECDWRSCSRRALSGRGTRVASRHGAAGGAEVAGRCWVVAVLDVWYLQENILSTENF